MIGLHVDLVIQVLDLGALLDAKSRVGACGLQHVTLGSKVCAVVGVLDYVEVAVADYRHCVVQVVTACALCVVLHIRPYFVDVVVS